MVACHVPRTGGLACNLGVRLDLELNWQPCGSLAGAQSTEPHQPGQENRILNVILIIYFLFFTTVIMDLGDILVI